MIMEKICASRTTSPARILWFSLLKVIINMNKRVLNVSKITGIINLLIYVFVFVAINTFLHQCSSEKSHEYFGSAGKKKSLYVLLNQSMFFNRFCI